MNYFLVLIRIFFLRSVGEDSDWMCYMVNEAVVFCQAVLARVTDVKQLLELRNIQAWFQFSVDIVAVSDGRWGSYE